MKTTFNFSIATIFACLFTLQSCVKDPIPVLHHQVDKLLLSKVTGSVSSQDPNFWPAVFNNFNTYSWAHSAGDLGPNSGDFQINYSYDNFKNTYFDCKRIVQESFLDSGSYIFSYNNLLPYKVIDNSVPIWDLGYWKFYYDAFKRVSKIGLAFSATTEPVQFEYYTKDFLGQIRNFMYGQAVDTPYMKVLYQYNWKGDISGLDIYLAKNQQSVANFTGASVENKQIKGYKTDNLNTVIFQKKLTIADNRKPVVKNNNTSYTVAAGIDTSIYVFYLSATVTTDNKINPYSQQNNIFFYQTNRWFSFYDITPYYLCLLKSNPSKIEYSVPRWGPDVATQTFSYTYNDKGYPVTVHEEFNDPDFAFAGTYTRDSKMEYISNY